MESTNASCPATQAFLHERGTILLAGSEYYDISPIIAAIESGGYQLLLVKDNSGAAVAAAETCPDLVLLDFATELGGHFTSLKKLKPPDTEEYLPVILISHTEEFIERLLVFNEGADDLFFTPLPFAAFLSRIEVLIHIRKLIHLVGKCENIRSPRWCSAQGDAKVTSLHEKIFTCVRNDLSVLSGRKLSLVMERGELDSTLKGTALTREYIGDLADMKKMKALLSHLSKDLRIGSEKWNSIIVATSEALSNVIKYAGKGSVALWKNNSTLSVRIDDEGPGVRLKDILRSVFIKCHSRQRIHKLGYPLMMELADELIIYTGTEGTSLVLHFSL
ncbi:MAG: ATP-binding protein [Candidatus Eremiobacteraeota bacterium]|nr:ATP-binding protein [Candidatus Eremiobacteraeota bacterium]